jgi:hypothetical protein
MKLLSARADPRLGRSRAHSLASGVIVDNGDMIRIVTGNGGDYPIRKRDQEAVVEDRRPFAVARAENRHLRLRPANPRRMRPHSVGRVERRRRPRRAREAALISL